MPRGSWSAKDERQYEAILASERARGASDADAKRIAAATVNKRRAVEARRTTTNPGVTMTTLRGRGPAPRGYRTCTDRTCSARRRGEAMHYHPIPVAHQVSDRRCPSSGAYYVGRMTEDGAFHCPHAGCGAMFQMSAQERREGSYPQIPAHDHVPMVG